MSRLTNARSIRSREQEETEDKVMGSYYEYVHRPGYGRMDHLADEVVARAARRLGTSGTDEYIAACVGLASHTVPMAGVSVRLPSGPGVRRRMVAALRAAERETLGGRYVDTRIDIECVRTIRWRRGEHREWPHDAVVERQVRRGRAWVTEAVDIIPE